MAQQRLAPALVAELVGTFALTFIGAGAGALGLGGLVGVAFAHGLVVLALCYVWGEVSGNHINPAVTAGLWAARKIDAGRALSYMAFQVVGAILAAFALRALIGAETGLGATTLARGLTVGGATITVEPVAGFLLEALLTFFLVNTVFNAAVAGRAGDMAPVAIGMTLVFCILMGGPLTGASLNPARTLGPAVALGEFGDLWVYVAGPIVGGVAAAFLYRALYERKVHR